MQAIFDYIIVGAGAAGCVVASRLSEDPRRRVLLLEAGPDIRPEAIPAIVRDPYPRSAYETGYLWPDLRVTMKEGRHGAAPAPPRHYEQGRVMGGGGSLMGMMALRGVPDDYDGWARDGAAGWAWNDVLPFFKRLERDLDFSGPLHGSDGPIPIRRHNKSEWAPFSKAIGAAMESDGYPFIEDHNADFREGNVLIAHSSLPGSRYSSAIGYLGRDVRTRPNLSIRTDTSVDNLVLEGTKVVGVRARSRAATETLRAREVIVCAGSLHSPAILQRAGVGPADTLKNAGVAPIVERIGVGKNLHNHPIIYIAAHLKKNGRQNANSPLTYNALRYSSGVAECPEVDMFMPALNISSWHKLGRSIGAIGITPYRSFSRGTVALRSADPTHEPGHKFSLL